MGRAQGRGSPSDLMLGPAPTLCQGVRRISPVTRAEEFYYPPWKRLLFQLLVSLPLCLTCLACVFLLMLGCFQLQVTSGPSPGLGLHLTTTCPGVPRAEPICWGDL